MYADLLVKDFVCPATAVLEGTSNALVSHPLANQGKGYAVAQSTPSMSLSHPFIFPRTLSLNCLRLQVHSKALLYKVSGASQVVKCTSFSRAMDKICCLKVICYCNRWCTHGQLVKLFPNSLRPSNAVNSGKLELYLPLLVQRDLNFIAKGLLSS